MAPASAFATTARNRISTMPIATNARAPAGKFSGIPAEKVVRRAGLEPATTSLKGSRKQRFYWHLSIFYKQCPIYSN